MTRSASAYKGGYKLDNPGSTDLDKLLANFAVLLDHAAAVAKLQDDTAPALGGNLDLRSFRIYSSIDGQSIEIVPTGAGGFRLNTIGQPLGAYSVDLQRYRDNANQVATGQYALAEGACNTASADHSHVEGFRAIADQYGAHTECSSDWIAHRAQRTDLSLCCRSTNGTAATLSVAGAVQGLVVPSNVTWLCEVHLLAVMDYGHTSAWVLRFAVQNNGATAHIVGVVKDEDDTSFNAGVQVPTPSGSALGKECTGAWARVYTEGTALQIEVRNPYETTQHCGTSWHADFHITELSMTPGGGTGGGN